MARRPSKIPGRTKPFSVRKMRVDLINRMYVVAKYYDDSTIEEVLNHVVARGLQVFEKPMVEEAQQKRKDH